MDETKTGGILSVWIGPVTEVKCACFTSLAATKSHYFNKWLFSLQIMHFQ